MPSPRHARTILGLSLALVVLSLVTLAPPPGLGPPGTMGAGAKGGRTPAPTAEVAPAEAAATDQPSGQAAGADQPAPGSVLRIPYRIELRSADPAVADALTVIPQVLEDPRGWQQADIDFVHDPEAPFVIVVAEGEDAQALCQPYDVDGRFSCQNGPLVVLNAIRWREGVAHWRDLPSYRTMLINHEVGHLLGMHHLRCTAPGMPAPVMEQQSGTLRGCQANPWPTDVELRLAATHQFAVAPPPLDVAFPP